MTPNKQVSSVIRISQRERDASARATHLEAATRKFLVTTNERKLMSTKTNFKRIALVAVAALGLGVLSSVPSNAAITSGSVAITTANGTASVSTVGNSDSRTAATLAVSALKAVAGDSMTVQVIVKSKPTGSTVTPLMLFSDTATSSIANVQVRTGGFSTSSANVLALNESTTASTGVNVIDSGNANTAAYVAATFLVFLESGTSSTIVAGTYTLTAIVNTYAVGGAAPTNATTKDFNIVVTAPAADSLVASAANSTAYLSEGSTFVSGTVVDSTVSAVATASTTAVAIVQVVLKNASGSTAAKESVTATISAGTIGDGTTQGRSVTLPYSSTVLNLNVRPDGTAGVATINISTPSVTFAPKKVTFYSASPTTLVASLLNTSMASGSQTAVAVKATDSAGNAWAGTLYSYSATTSVISNDGTNTCSYVAARLRHECALVGLAAGTSAITVRDASTVALSTVSSNAVTATVSLSTAASFKLSFDKAIYAPGEKATITLEVLDAAGKSVPNGTYTDLFASSSGIGSDRSFTDPGTGLSAATALTGVTHAMAAPIVADYTKSQNSPMKLFTQYMPMSGGTITISATGGSGLPAAGQVKVSATATVRDDAAAALAAVNALATTVASLKTLITTLTNLVLKIQKKVKA